MNDYFSGMIPCKYCSANDGSQKVPGAHLLLDMEFAFYPGVHMTHYKNAANTMALDNAPTTLSVGVSKYKVC